MSKTNIGATLWIFCLQYFVAEAMAISGWPGSYSLSDNYISDLGAVGCDVAATGVTGAAARLCSPLHALMNTSFVLQGLLIIGGAALVWPRFPRGALWAAALLLIGASGIGVFVVGLAPEDAMPRAHFVGAIDNFMCCNLGMATMGVAMLSGRPPARKLGLVTFGAGIIGLAGLGFLATRSYLGLGVGGMERVTAYPFPLWLAAMGVMLLRNSALIGSPDRARRRNDGPEPKRDSTPP
jgi:hypothetical membrane protein